MSTENTSNTSNVETTEQTIARLTAENAALKALAPKPKGMKVSEKGGVSIYGLGRFPITLYKSQWVKLLDMADAIRAFIKDNDAKLATKGE